MTKTFWELGDQWIQQASVRPLFNGPVQVVVVSPEVGRSRGWSPLGTRQPLRWMPMPLPPLLPDQEEEDAA